MNLIQSLTQPLLQIREYNAKLHGHPCWHDGMPVAIGVPLSVFLITAGVANLSNVKYAYDHLKTVDNQGKSNWSKLNTQDKISAILKPVGSVALSSMSIGLGVLSSYNSYLDSKACGWI